MVVDFHCHILPASFPQRLAELRARDVTFASLLAGPDPRMATAEALLRDMDRDGVDRAVVMGMGWTSLALAQEANDYLAQAVNLHPQRLTGFCSVNPAWGDAAVAELERCVQAGLRGVGELHADTQGFDLTHRDTMRPLMDAARRLDLPVLVHSSEPVGHQYAGKGQTTPDKLYRFIQQFPDNVIVCAHWGGGLPFYAMMPEVPPVLKNVYFDSAASPFLYRPEVFSAVARLVGPERILLGTDYPLLGHRRLLRQVAESGLPEGQQAAILGGNASRLLGLGPEAV